jgi:hypothetical protein
MSGVARSKVSLNSSRPLRAFPREGTIIDESPALTAVLQAQPGRIVPSGVRWGAGTGVLSRAGGGESDRPGPLSARDADFAPGSYVPQAVHQLARRFAHLRARRLARRQAALLLP